MLATNIHHSYAKHLPILEPLPKRFSTTTTKQSVRRACTCLHLLRRKTPAQDTSCALVQSPPTAPHDSKDDLTGRAWCVHEPHHPSKVARGGHT